MNSREWVWAAVIFGFASAGMLALAQIELAVLFALFAIGGFILSLKAD